MSASHNLPKHPSQQLWPPALFEGHAYTMAASGSATGTSEQLEESMDALIQRVLQFRKPEYIDGLKKVLSEQGITKPKDLSRVSMDALEVKLSTAGGLDFMQMSDVISLREAMRAAHFANGTPRWISIREFEHN